MKKRLRLFFLICPIIVFSVFYSLNVPSYHTTLAYISSVSAVNINEFVYKDPNSSETPETSENPENPENPEIPDRIETYDPYETPESPQSSYPPKQESSHDSSKGVSQPRTGNRDIFWLALLNAAACLVICIFKKNRR